MWPLLSTFRLFFHFILIPFHFHFFFLWLFFSHFHTIFPSHSPLLILALILPPFIISSSFQPYRRFSIPVLCSIVVILLLLMLFSFRDYYYVIHGFFGILTLIFSSLCNIVWSSKSTLVMPKEEMHAFWISCSLEIHVPISKLRLCFYQTN